MSQISSTKCIHCHSTIPEKAKVCPECTQHQNKYRSLLLFIGSIIAIIVAFTTAIIHSISIFPDMLTSLYPEPSVKVLQFNSSKRIIIANTGNSDMLVSHIHYEPQIKEFIEDVKIAMLGNDLLKEEKDILRGALSGKDIPFMKNKSIGENISRGSVLSHDLKSSAKGKYVRGFKEKEWHALFALALASDELHCFSATLFSPDDRRYKSLINEEKTILNTFPAYAYLYVYSPILDKTIPLEFNAVGVLRYDDSFLKDNNLSKKIAIMFEKHNKYN